MSIQTLTLDEFMRLTKEDHQDALDLFDAAISSEIAAGHTLEADYDRFVDSRDKLGRLLTLRKLHQGCLDELAVPAPLASQQFFNNELDQLPS